MHNATTDGFPTEYQFMQLLAHTPAQELHILLYTILAIIFLLAQNFLLLPIVATPRYPQVYV